MHLSFAITALAAGWVTAYPGMGDGLLKELHSRQQFGQSTTLLGDLATLPDSKLTAAGKTAKGILQTTLSPLGPGASRYKAPGRLGTKACAKDTCCIWKWIEAELSEAFKSPNGQCNGSARGAIRLGFHDAATWTSTSSYGGADGSIILASGELPRSENAGLAPIAAKMTHWYNKYRHYGVTAADLIQFAAILATVICPLGPQMYFLVGRPDSHQAPPHNLLPLPSQDAPALISLFEAKTFTAHDLVALLGAHSTSQQFFVDRSKAGQPQDSTVGVWDVLYYNQTLLPKAPKGVFRFHSDVSVAQYADTTATWKVFGAPKNQGQAAWNPAYAQAYFRMSLLGVKHINDMTDCTKVLPAPRTTFPGIPSGN